MKTQNPIIVANESWGTTIPEWVLDEIASERMITGLIAAIVGKEEEQVGDAEIAAYLYTTVCTHPIARTESTLYFYCLGRMLKKAGRKESFEALKLIDGYVEKLTDYEKSELVKLKGELYRRRKKVKHPIFDIIKSLKKEAKQKPKQKTLI